MGLYSLQAQARAKIKFHTTSQPKGWIIQYLSIAGRFKISYQQTE
jgi:hypothetical protein